jgi:hypothetical protein
MEIRTIGIGLGKTVFHFVGVNARGQVVVRKKGSRTQIRAIDADRQWQRAAPEKTMKTLKESMGRIPKHKR